MTRRVSAGRAAAPGGPYPAPYSQTLDRGLRVLEALAEAECHLTVTALAETLGLHRSVAYRIVRTLEDHRLVRRRPDGSFELGYGLSVLSRGVTPTLQSAATPELADLANDLGMTAFLAVADRDECVTLLSVEPRHSHAHVAYRPGARHPIDRGAPGLALLAAGPFTPGERAEVTIARQSGFASSRGEVLRGMSAVAAPVLAPNVTAAVAVVFVDGHLDGHTDEGLIGQRVQAAARAVAAELT